MEIGVIGAGVQGYSTAVFLSALPDVSKIILCDRDSLLLSSLSKQIGSDKIFPIVCDASELSANVAIFSHCDIIIDLLPPKYALCVMDFALMLNAHYINSAYDKPFWDEIVCSQELSKNVDFCLRGKSALLGFGYSPGLVNVIIRKYCDLFDYVETIDIYGTYLQDESINPSPWLLQWSPEQALKDYFTKPCVYCNGHYYFKNLFSEREFFNFGSFGCRSVCLHSHEEVYSIPKSIDKRIGAVRFKFQYNDFFEKLSRLGFLPDNSLDVDGQTVKPFNLLVRLIPAPVHYYLNDRVKLKDEYITVVVIVGTIGNQRFKMSVEIPTPDCNIPRINPEVAIPVAVACRLLTLGLNRGILFAEQISPDSFLKELNKLTNFHESCTFEEV